MEKYISVIVPCYNATAYLDRCINSLLKQTIGYEHLEMIFVNDASTDNTLDLLLSYEKKYEDNILVINCEKNGRQGTARNIGIKYSSCDYIAFLDQDDWIAPTMYEKLYNKAIEKDLDVSGCLSIRARDEYNFEEPVYLEESQYFVIENEEMRNEFIRTWRNDGFWVNLYRKEIILKHDIWFAEGLVYDDNYFVELLKFYVRKIYVLNEGLHYYCENFMSAINSNNEKWHFDRLDIEDLLMDAYKERGIYNTYKEYINTSFLERYFFNSLFVFFTRFHEMPIEIFNRMAKNIKEKLPDYKNYVTKDDIDEEIVKLIEKDVTQEKLNIVQDAYIDYFGLEHP